MVHLMANSLSLLFSQWQGLLKVTVTDLEKRSCYSQKLCPFPLVTILVAVSIHTHAFIHKFEMLLGNSYSPGTVLDSEETKIIKQADSSNFTVE